MSRSAERAFEILEIVGASKKGLKHGEIAQALNIPKSSVSKLLTSLVARDYLAVDTVTQSYVLLMSYLLHQLRHYAQRFRL
jgi:DNA-binding IclR family transcriptional regulator